jgi:excinuclease ABC subunit A
MSAPAAAPARVIRIVGARQHNLKNLTLELPRDRFVVITGPSGSGKSSLAFDTLYAEGQRRYVESLSAYARQFLDQMQKPEVDHIEGLSPAIAIEQRSASGNARSIVATTTEIYDYLRLLYAHLGEPHCPGCGRPVKGQSVQQIADNLLALPPGRRLMLLAPILRGKKGEHKDVLEQLRREGFARARVDGEVQSLEDELRLSKQAAHTIEAVVDRLVTGEVDSRRVTDSVERALRVGEGLLLTLLEDEQERGRWHESMVSERLACVPCNRSIGELLPRNFSFNSPYGACPTCHGLGSYEVLDPDELVRRDRSLQNGAFPLLRTGPRRLVQYHNHLLRAVATHYGVPLNVPFRTLPEPVQHAFLHGSGSDDVRFDFRWGGRQHQVTKPFEGVVSILNRRFRETDSVALREKLHKIATRQPCPDCRGARLRPESLAVTLRGRNIHDFTRSSVDAAAHFLAHLNLQGEAALIGRDLLREISSRLGFLQQVGLGYLTLNRESGTLSGGEAQRIRLATQVGSGLTGVMYVLDEPTIGLHPRDNRRLLDTLLRLRDIGNTVIVVEHDPETILAADYLLDLGPAAGEHGGHLVAAGTPAEVLANPASLTGQYLSGAKAIAVPTRRLAGNGRRLTIRGAAEHNLKHLDVSFPLGTLTCVTGVSGSGKSTLVNHILVRALQAHFDLGTLVPGRHTAIDGLDHIDKLIVIDQSPIGRTPRSNPATYTGAFDLIRTLFAGQPEAKLRGYQPGRFSFNVKGGRCEACAGDGIKKIEMQFLPDVYVPCEECKGQRYNRETLAVTYKGRHIAEVLDLTVSEACDFFRAIPRLARLVDTLERVGLGYLHLGQAATTLSGGEAQRVKLATELARVPKGHTLYVLDEPTTGLHLDDVAKLLQVLLALRDQGNTVLIIEHNLDVIKVADHLLDLGPEGGEAGGHLVASGTPEEVALVTASYTGQYLRPLLYGARPSSCSSAARRAASSGDQTK